VRIGMGQGYDVSSGFAYDEGSMPLASTSQVTPSSDALTTSALLAEGFSPSQITSTDQITGTSSSSGISTTSIGLIAVVAVAVLLLMGVGKR
jgi:hypothetical protein